MNITIRTIPHSKQAYNTPGDWRFDRKGNLNIFVSDMGNWKYELLIAIHELFEVALCKDRRITTEEVDAFDILFEDERSVGLHSREDEPGHDPRAPYKREHFVAEIPERLLAHELDVDYQDYDKTVTALQSLYEKI